MMKIELEQSSYEEINKKLKEIGVTDFILTKKGIGYLV